MSAEGVRLLAVGDLAGAVVAFDRALALSPNDSAAAAGRARCAVRRGEADAVARVGAARRLAPADAELALLEAEAECVAGRPDAGATLERLLQHHRGWANGHRQLGSIRLEAGLGRAALAPLAAAVAAEPKNGALWNVLIELQAGAGWHADAADSAARARAAGFADPMLDLIEATHAGTAGDLKRSERLLARVPVGVPGRDQLAIRHAIRIGALDRAERQLGAARQEAPGDVGLWALTDIVWRAIGHPRAEWLSGQDGLVRVASLDWDAATLNSLAAVLRPLHTTRGQPVGQSVRAGTQTRGRLFDRAEPMIQRLAADLQRAVDAHRAALPPVDPDHPLSRLRDRSVRVDGGWSVRLGAAGHHSSHIHTAGVLSSAFYVAVPPLDPVIQEGWLELGRPPDDLPVSLEPRHVVEPRRGQLVLFPSFLYHCTRPFAAGERLTVAFDAA